MKKDVSLFGNKKVRFLMNEENYTAEKLITDLMILPLLQKNVTFGLEITGEFITICSVMLFDVF